jgi:MFS family permease
MRFAGTQMVGVKRMRLAFSGNVRVLILTEFFWAVPAAWYGFYFPIFAKDLGLDAATFGLVTALGCLIHLPLAPIGGLLADRLGRKLSVMLTDSIAWTFPMLVFAFSKNAYHLVIAVLLNNLYAVAISGWECLYAEGVPRRHMAAALSLRWVAYMMPGITTGFAGWIISQQGTIDGTRLLFIIAFFSMSTGVGIRWFLLKETSPNPKKQMDLSSVSYKEALAALWGNNRLAAVLLMQFILFTTGMVMATFFPRFLVDKEGGLGLSEALSSIIPTVQAAMLTVFPLVMTVNVKERNAPMLASMGVGVLAVGMALYVILPAGSIVLAAAAMLVLGCGMGMGRPVAESLVGVTIPPRLRARLMGLLWGVSMGGSGVGLLMSGYIYDYFGPRTLFGIVAAAIAAAFAMAVTVWRMPAKAKKV